jgi:MarR family 2-MHQ and catechol resistance regulon transcriptional repressor
MVEAPFLPSLRALARCYQAFFSHSAAHLRTLGLTPPQFDIVATLGNTPGMTPKELGEQTLITKGTLTGVVDRLAEKGLVRRIPSALDGRSQIVQLTKKGERLFDKVFPAHVAYFSRVFADLKAEDYARIEAALRVLRAVFESSRMKQ